MLFVSLNIFWSSVSDTVKSDCPVQIFRKMMKYLKIQCRLLVFTLLVSLFVSGDVKKKRLWKKNTLKITSELIIFRAFFSPPTLNLKINPVSQVINKIWPYTWVNTLHAE